MYSSLFSDHESEYLSYVFDQRSFDSALALRNKYSHGSDPLDDSNGFECEQDYILLLHVLICVLLKINDELADHVGIELDVGFVDWPLAG